MQRIDGANSGWRRRQVVGGLLLTLVTLLAVVLRLKALDEPLWVDELHTGWTIRDGLATLPSRAAAGNQAPLYFVLPWLATRGLGLAALGLRLPSLMAGTLVVPLAGWLAWRWTRSTTAAVLAALLVALDRNFVFYAVEARCYAVIECLGLVQIAAFVALVRRPPGRGRAVWLAAGVLLFYLHYTTALATLSQLLVLVLLRRSPARLGRDLAILTCGWLPALWHLGDIARRRENWSSRLQPDDLATLVPWLEYGLLPLLLVLLAALILRLRRRRPLVAIRRLRRLAPLVPVVLLPVLVSAAVTLAGWAQLQRYRYVMISQTLAPLLAALLVATVPRRGLRVTAAVIVILASLPPSELVVRFEYPGNAAAVRRERWAEVVQFINDSPNRARWPVLLCADLVEDRSLVATAASPGEVTRDEVVAYCRFPVRSVYRLEQTDTQIVPLATHALPRLTAQARHQIRAASGAWLIVRGSVAAANRIAAEIATELSGPAGSFAVNVAFDSGDSGDNGNLTLLSLVASPN